MNFDFIKFSNQALDILNLKFGGNTIDKYLTAFGVFVLAIFLSKIFKTFLLRGLTKCAQRTRVKFDDAIMRVIDAVGWPLYVLLSIYWAVSYLVIPHALNWFLLKLIMIVIVYYAVKGIQVLIDFWAGRLVTKKQKEIEIDSSAANILSKVLKGVLWVVALIVVIQSFGYKISTLLAGVGIGGVALAFALQNILADIFASFSIHFDKPFKVGDFIVVGSDMGTVKSVGIKSTRLHSLQGEELIISNKELTTARIHNYKRMEKRRIVFNFGVPYETPMDKLKKIPEIIISIMKKINMTEVERIYFKEFGQSSLIFELVYHLNSVDFENYVRVRELLNLALKEAFEKEDIKLSCPT